MLAVNGIHTVQDGAICPLYGINAPVHRYLPGDMARVASLGFNTVRIPIVWLSDPVAADDAYSPGVPGNIDPKTLSTLSMQLSEAAANGLFVSVVINGCAGDFFSNPAKQAQFIALWTYLAKQFPNQIDLYELISEPTATVLELTEIYNEAISAIVAVNSNAVFMVGMPGYTVSGLANPPLLLNSTNVVYTFDGYFPNQYVLQLTHGHPTSTYPGILTQTNGKTFTMDAAYMLKTALTAYTFSLANGVPVWCNQLGIPWATPGAQAWFGDASKALSWFGFAIWVLRSPYNTTSIPDVPGGHNAFGDFGLYAEDSLGNWKLNTTLLELIKEALPLSLPKKTL